MDLRCVPDAEFNAEVRRRNGHIMNDTCHRCERARNLCHCTTDRVLTTVRERTYQSVNADPIGPRPGVVSDPDAVRWEDRLVFDVNMPSESPCVKGTWITASQVVSQIVDGSHWSDVLRAHPELTEDDIRACLAYTADRDESGPPAPVDVRRQTAPDKPLFMGVLSVGVVGPVHRYSPPMDGNTFPAVADAVTADDLAAIDAAD
jgi:uncharacterized protein (DUF433 family)